MTTAVEFHFVLPTGEPISDARVEVQLTRSSFNDNDPGVTMPRPVIARTDVNGKVTLNLWPSDVLYYVTVQDLVSEAGISYKFLVPEVPTGSVLQLQDLIVDLRPAGTAFDGATFLAIQQAKAEVMGMRGEMLVNTATSEAAALAAQNALNTFRDAYLGQKNAAPSVDNDGDPLLVGALYFDNTSKAMFVWDGLGWGSIGSGGGGGGGSVVSVAGRSGIVVLTKGDVDLANVNNTADADKPVSTAMQTALNAKQATLVSGTTIKTINGVSVLGSGDMAIAGGSGGGVTSFNGRTGVVALTSGDVTAVLGGAAAGSAFTQVVVTTDVHNAVAGQLVVMTSLNQCACIAPEFPAAGDKFAVMFLNGRSDNLIGYSGESLCGVPGNITADIKGVTYTFQYISTVLDWRLI